MQQKVSAERVAAPTVPEPENKKISGAEAPLIQRITASRD
jgi:hypothetical protein